MTNNNLVSILMPAFNAENFIESAIQSVLNQTHQNLELLIIDDGSTDATSAIMSKLKNKKIRIFKHQTNKGYLATCNALFKLAKGGFITFLDADDTCPKDRISACLQVFEENEKVNFLTTDHVRMDISENTISEYSSKVDFTRYSRQPEYYPLICCATIMLKRDFLKKVGGYHPFFNDIGGEDYHWLFRLSRAGNGYHLRKKLYNYRRHEKQFHRKNENLLKFFVQDIDMEIRKELIANNSDLLLNSDKLRFKWKKIVTDYPERLLFKKATWMLNAGDRKQSLALALSALKTAPGSLTSWQHFLYLLYSSVRR